MSKIPRSPTAVTVDTPCDPSQSQPEWKKELIRRKTLQKRVFIRLPNSLLQREKNAPATTATTQPSSSAAAINGDATTGANSSNKLVKSGLNNDNTEIDGGVNGFAMTKAQKFGNKLAAASTSTSVDGAGVAASLSGSNEYASVSQTWRNKPSVSSNNNEYDVIRAWLPQSGGEGGTNEVTTAEGKKISHDTSNDLVVDGWRVSDGRQGGSPMQFQQGIKPLNQSKETMGDLSSPVTNGDMHFVNGKSDFQHEIDGLNGNDDSYNTKRDDDFDPDYDYGPGIVNRLKAKFITLSLKGDAVSGFANHLTSPVSPISPVRRVASMEHLLDVSSDDEHSSPLTDNLTHGLVGRTKGLYEKNVNAMRNSNHYSKFQNSTKLKRARSMDNVTAIDRGALMIPKDFLSSKNVIIIEQPKPQPTETPKNNVAVTNNNKTANTNNSNPNLQSNGEYPLPNTVREYMKLFEHPDENKNALVVVGTGGGNSPVSGVAKPVKPKITVPKPKLVAPLVKTGSAGNRPASAVSEPSEQNCNVPSSNCISKVPSMDTEPQPNSNSSPAEVDNFSSSVRCRIDAFSDLTAKSQHPQKPSANTADAAMVKAETPKTNVTTVETTNPVMVTAETITTVAAIAETANTVVVAPAETQKPVVAISPVPREPLKSHVEEAVVVKPPKIVDYKLQHIDKINSSPQVTNGGNPFVQLRSYHPAESNTMIISIDDNKPRPAHLPNINNKQSSHYEHDETDNDKYYGSEDDDDDGGIDTTDSRLVNFVGANIIVGKSALLKTRNKKLQLLFDDKAVSTYEYPSEWTLLNDRSDSDECEDNDTTNCDNNIPNNTSSKSNEVDSEFEYTSPSSMKLSSNPALSSSGGLGSYTPMAVGSDQVFELGISKAPQPLPVTITNGSPNLAEVDAQDDSTLSLKPAADDENVLWSSTQTSDILF